MIILRKPICHLPSFLAFGMIYIVNMFSAICCMGIGKLGNGFSAWALANWAMASDANRSHIQELDRDGKVVMTALMAPERTVKWHGSLVARLLLEDLNLPLSDSVSDWNSSLLATGSHASKTEDISLAHVALSAFLVSVDRSDKARMMVMEKGLQLMRDSARNTRKHRAVQEGLSKPQRL